MYAVVARERDVRAAAARFLDQLLEQEMRALGTFVLEHRIERLEPLPGFLRIDVRRDVLHVHGESPSDQRTSATARATCGVERQGCKDYTRRAARPRCVACRRRAAAR